MKNLTELNSLEFDIARTSILNRYMNSWGPPLERVNISYNNELVAEVYEFKDCRVHRFATIGSFRFYGINESEERFEYLLVLDSEDERYDREVAIAFVRAVLISAIERAIPVSLPWVLSDNKLDNQWPTFSLIDEARGEEVDIAAFRVGNLQISLGWIIPIYESEAKFIAENGIESFDENIEANRLDVIKISRKSVIG